MSPLSQLNFDRIYVINLKRRPDRWEHAGKQLADAGIECKQYEAVDGQQLQLKHPFMTAGMVGCWMTHRDIFKEAVENGYESILIFEDDLKLIDGFNLMLSLSLSKLPADWEFVYLGYTHYDDQPKTGLQKVNDFWIVPANCWGTQGYMVRGKEAIRKVYEGIKEVSKEQWQVDQQISMSILPESGLRYYAHYPSVVRQAGLTSDVQTQKLIFNE
ncbi:glycosyltransferase family 25 protein [Xanthocytophaga agilis]|uniref:Glycosyltransferase family 25 protein n=1 Tax=Xanthocytophaga agilis TaxID=3048010 RepID=A0AAE3R4E0_9BACT|nr:glycosyltransferase family 25 protein [Xanthocytophaga agilis]MDJ1500467.1 glycosyltransferase family 25 protein [Xanthocytophaga agilis]